MDYSFKKLKISDVEKRWLQEIAEAEFSEIDINALKVKFRNQLKDGFNPDKIDRRLIQDRRLTLVGYWYLDSNHKILDQVSSTIEGIRELIIQKRDVQLVNTSTVSTFTEADKRRGEMILRLIYDLSGFFKSGGGPDQTKCGMEYAEFYKNDKTYDEFIKFQKLENKLEEFFLNRSRGNIERGQTGWPKVNRQLKKAQELLFRAKSAEDFQNVGLCCREALISLSQEVYDEEKHKTVDGKKPSKADFKRMLNAYISTELGGSSNEEFRSLVKKVKRVANATQHKRTADNLHARLCVEATTSLIEMIRILDQER